MTSRTRLPLVLPALLAACACAVNPATGRRQTMFISEESEFEIGKQADARVREEFGVYLEKPELRAYLTEVGERLARQSARPDIQYHFELLDTPVVNAFALPGGFVYMTRGILERMNSEDELAAVMGHEIAHVAARHGAAQISKAYLAQAGVIALSVLTSPQSAALVSDLANLSLTLAFQGYSREYERQADEFGFQYAEAAGYNPKGAVDLLQTLARMEKTEPTAVEAFFLSHPRTSERIASAKDEVAGFREKDPDRVRQARVRDPYLERLDGMIVGEWNGTSMILGGRLYDKEHGFAVGLPEGFTAKLGSGNLIAVFEREKEKMQAGFRIEPLPRKQSPADLMKEFAEKNRGLDRVSDGPLDGAALSMHQALFNGRDRDGRPIEARVAFASERGLGISLILVSPRDAGEDVNAIFGRMARSLAPLTSEEAARVQPPRLTVRRVAEGDTWASLAGLPPPVAGGDTGEMGAGPASSADVGDTGAAASKAVIERLAYYNGFDPAEPPPAGKLVKIPPSLSVE